MRELVDRSTQHFALIRRTDQTLTRLAIFVHGFRGNYWTTWGGLPSQLQNEADNRPVFADWDYVFMGYATGAIGTYLDIAQLIWTEWRKAARGEPPYEHKYETFAFFGHSLGTLGLRQALCASTLQPAGMMKQLKSVTLFGSPVNGSGLANFAIGSKIARALEPGNPQLRMLKLWTESMHDSLKWPDVRVVLGLDDKVVGYVNGELMEWKGDERPPALTHLDHRDLVKPKGWNTPVIDFIHAGLQ